MKKKIAYVVQRYGLDVNGGSEFECRELSEHLADRYDVEVLTTCARSVSPWDNYYEPGVSEINGVTVRRFPVEKVNDGQEMPHILERMNQGDEEAEIRWIKEKGPYCPRLIQYLQENADRYMVVIFQTYDFYPTVMGLQLGIKNSIIVPTAHDEPNIFKRIYERSISAAAGILYNSIEEREFLIEKFGTGNKPGRTTCVGMKECHISDWELPLKYRQYQNYVIYVGRVAYGKNYMQLNRYFMEYKKRHPDDLKLLVLGRINQGMPLVFHEDIVYLDFVSEKDKMRLIRHAKLLLMPSLYESLSLVILESMQVGTPVVVNGDCAVLRGQCIRSNAGLYYTSYSEFEKSVDLLRRDQKIYEKMAENGRNFVRDHYQWEQVVEEVGSLIEEIGEGGL